MNTKTLTSNFFSIAVPFISILTLITLARLGWTLWDMYSVEKTSGLSSRDFSHGKLSENGKESPEDNFMQGNNAVPIEGLPSIMKKNSYFYMAVSNYSVFSKEMYSTSVIKIWNSPGVKEAAAPIADPIQNAWMKFKSTYRFSLDKVFKGLGPYTEQIECVISDFGFFKDNYTVRLAASCSIKGNAEAFIRKFKDNAAGLMASKAVKGISVFQQKSNFGTFSVFFYNRKMFITAGRGMCEYLINLLQNRNRITSERFSDNPDFIAAYSLWKKKGVFVYAADEMIKEILQKSYSSIKGPIGVSCSIQDGNVYEDIMLPSENILNYIKRGSIFKNINDSENVIGRVQGRLTQKMVEALATLSLRMYRSSFNVKLTKSIEGSFWDYVCLIADGSKGLTIGNLKWDEDGLVPSWYFITDIRNNTWITDWLAKLSEKFTVTEIPGPESLKIFIVPLKKSLGHFGSFCYFIYKGSIYYSYNSQLLKNMPLSDAIGKDNIQNADISFMINAGEAAEFIETKNFQGLFKEFKWFEIDKIPRLSETGSKIGSFRLFGKAGKPYSIFHAESGTGCTGIVPLIIYFNYACNLREE